MVNGKFGTKTNYYAVTVLSERITVTGLLTAFGRRALRGGLAFEILSL